MAQLTVKHRREEDLRGGGMSSPEGHAAGPQTAKPGQGQALPSGASWAAASPCLLSPLSIARELLLTRRMPTQPPAAQDEMQLGGVSGLQKRDAILHALPALLFYLFLFINHFAAPALPCKLLTAPLEGLMLRTPGLWNFLIRAILLLRRE